MAALASSIAEISAASKRITRRALDIGENRLELLVVEVQEARERLLHAFVLALGMAVCALLAGLTLTAGIVVLSWESHPLVALGLLTALYSGAAIFLHVRLTRLRCEWQAFSATLDQLRKDHECLADLLR